MISMHKKRLLIGLCSWNNPDLLKGCIFSIIQSLDFSKDGIAVVLNEADSESANFLLNLKIPFMAVPENRGVLAIDYLKPFIENSEYFLNTNDDMLFCLDFADDLIKIIEENYPASSSCMLVENFYSNNPCVVVDTELKSEISIETYNTFINKWINNIYNKDQKIISYCHPICVKSKDYLAIGGYSGDWDMSFRSGYGRDDMFAYNLWKLHGFNFKHICSNTSFVFHASSASMKKLSQELKDENNLENFRSKTGISIQEFRQKINLGSYV